MNHIATITKSSKLLNLPFHAQCSCGTAGTFPERAQAITYLTGHGQNVKSLSPANSFELIDNSDKPEGKAVLPQTHVAGVGNMPTSHSALGADVPQVVTGPPAPPPPPDAKKE
jgi:hypothetical protein